MDNKTRLSLALIILATLWMLSGLVFSTSHAPEETETKQVKADVRAAMFSSIAKPRDIRISATSFPYRNVPVSAQISGPVIELPVIEGSQVKQGTPLCKIADQGRTDQLQQAKSALKKAELDHKAFLKLKKSNLQSDSAIAGSLAAVDNAKFNLTQAELAVNFLSVRAPFDGIFEQRAAELGQLMAPGSICGYVVDINPLKVIGYASETEVSLLQAGQNATVTLAGTTIVEGEVSFVGSNASGLTKTFKVEVIVPNRDLLLVAGQTAAMDIHVGEQQLHAVPAQLLTLDADGQIGLRGIDQDNRVVFFPITLMENDTTTAWVAGLPDQTSLITVGHEYVSVGQVVSWQLDDAWQSAADSIYQQYAITKTSEASL